MYMRPKRKPIQDSPPAETTPLERLTPDFERKSLVFVMPEQPYVIGGQKRGIITGTRVISNETERTAEFRESILGLNEDGKLFEEYSRFIANKVIDEEGAVTYVRDLGGEIYEHFTPPAPEIFINDDGGILELNIPTPQDDSTKAKIEFTQYGESNVSIQERAVRLMVMNAKLNHLEG